MKGKPRTDCLAETQRCGERGVGGFSYSRRSEFALGVPYREGSDRHRSLASDLRALRSRDMGFDVSQWTLYTRGSSKGREGQ